MPWAALLAAPVPAAFPVVVIVVVIEVELPAWHNDYGRKRTDPEPGGGLNDHRRSDHYRRQQRFDIGPVWSDASDTSRNHEDYCQ